MAIPGFHEFMLPLLQFCGDGQSHTINEINLHCSKADELTAEDISQSFPSGNGLVFNNRVQWARSYLKLAGLLKYPERGLTQITENGMKVLKENPPQINKTYLKQFPQYFKRDEKIVPASLPETIIDGIPPFEAVEYGYKILRDELANELLDMIKARSPLFFEKLVVKLLVKMGYGGSIQDAGIDLGRSGDEGIDGLIKQDHLGLEMIYLQAKRWKGQVGSAVVRDFAGALQGKQAKKGVLITTSSFSRAARKYAEKIENKIVLMDGAKVTELMIDFNVGVYPFSKYEIKKIDFDYFEE